MNALKHILNILIWIFLSIHYVGAQLQNNTAFIRQISSAEGLSSQSIYDLFVNKEGLLFLGTNKGLISYNGTFFKTYSFQDNLALSINSIKEDQKGKLWCKNFSDQLFYFENDTLKAYLPVQDFLEQKQENLVEFTFFNNKLYLLTEHNLYVQDSKEVFKQIFNTDKSSSEIFFSIDHDEALNELYLASNSFIYSIQNNKVFQKTPTVYGQKDLKVKKNNFLYVIKGDQNQLFSGDKEIQLQSKEKFSVYYYTISNTGDTFWLCTSNGVYEVDLLKKQLANPILSNHRITDIVQDKEGNHWISSLDHGLFFMPNIEIKLLNIPTNNASQINTTALHCDDKGHLFVGTAKGQIVEFNEDLNPIFIYNGDTNIEVENIFSLKNQLITSIGVFQFGSSSPMIKAYFGKDYALDDYGNLLVANYNIAGLIASNFNNDTYVLSTLEQKELIPYANSVVKMYPFRNKRARAVHFKSNDGYYIGFSDGLYHYGLEGKVTQIFTAQGERIAVVDFHENEFGEIWAATSQQGMLLIENAKLIKQFNTFNGLSSDKCRKIQSDDNGIWVITDESLDFYNYETQQLTNFGNNLGLNGISLNDFFVNKTHIWFATNQGVLYFPKSILDKDIEPHLSIVAFQNDGLPIMENEKIPYEKNDLIFSFESILYKSMGNYNFEYKLEPFQTEWQVQDAKQTQLNFITLKPNKYELKARIKAGSLISSEVVFPFIVSKPFWMKPWFILLIIVFLSITLTFVYNWAVFRTKKKEQLNEMLAISQLTALRSQMNPHFMFNVLNAIQGLIYSNQKNKANEYIGTFSTLMRNTLAISDKREVSIAEEVKTIELYISLEKARFEEEEFSYTIHLPEDDLSMFTIPTLIIQPFVENAIKHGLLHKRGNKNLKFELTKKDNYYWRFIIQDNGVGRKTSQHINKKIKKNHSSFATNAIASRIQLINKLSDIPIEIEIDDLETIHHEPTGTRVTLYIPIKPIKE